MVYLKLFSKRIPSEQILDYINGAISTIYALSPEEYNSSVFYDIALGFRFIINKMGDFDKKTFPLFLKWLKLYVAMQHQIDPKNVNLSTKFENKIPVCTSYIVASLQYQPMMANYHLKVMEMCLSLFDSASPEAMEQIAELEVEIIALIWTPVEFAGDYNTQKMSLRLIVKILKHLRVAEKRKRLAEIETSPTVRNLLLRLAVDDANFEKISRELLNEFNLKTTKCCAVFSVYCTTALFGSFELFKPAVDKFWIDFNYTSKTVSFLCQLKQSDRHCEELSIKIKIDKLQIENQFDCIVLSIEPAIFSAEVSTELKNARLAVFTLPQSEIERLKANHDLIEYYKNNAYSESDTATIEKYLVEDSQMEDDNPKNLSSENSIVWKSLMVKVPKLSINNSKESAIKKSKENTKVITQRQENLSINANSPITKNAEHTLSTEAELSLVTDLPNRALLNKESEYNTGTPVVRKDSALFKKPTKPIRKKTKQRKFSRTASKSFESVKTVPKPVEDQQSPPTLKDNNSHASQSLISGKTSRRFFKKAKQASTLPKKTKQIYRKKPANTNTGISPKRKQVNTVKPLNHLTKADCDPEEAALEYVENGGYANISSFLRSNAGANTFSEKQREQILKNAERINEDVERGTKRFFQKEDVNSETDSSASIWRRTTRSQKRKPTPKTAEVTDFVPYSMWKTKQKKKTNSQSTMVEPESNETVVNESKASLNAFDQLKCHSLESSGASCSKRNTFTKTSANRTAIADSSSSSSSTSSRSNHNFNIAESESSVFEETSDEEAMLADMVCRREPEKMERSSITVPMEVPPTQSRKSNLSSSQISLTADVLEDASRGMVVRNDISTIQSSQRSEIEQDRSSPPLYRAQMQLTSDFQSKQQATSVDSSSSSEEDVISSNRTTTPKTPHTQLVENQDQNRAWYTDKSLTDHQPSCSSNESPICLDLTPTLSSDPKFQNITTTNQLIIQNQYVMSTTARKRMMPADSEESPLAKIPSGVHRVSLRGFACLLPNYMEKVTTEKDRLLKELEHNLQEDYFQNFNQIADKVMQSMKEHETAINEAQEQLSNIYGRLESLIENQQKNRFQLETIYCQLIGRIRVYLPKKDDIDEAYKEIINKLCSYATNTSVDLWQTFANEVITSIEDRLKGLVEL